MPPTSTRPLRQKRAAVSRSAALLHPFNGFVGDGTADSRWRSRGFRNRGNGQRARATTEGEVLAPSVTRALASGEALVSPTAPRLPPRDGLSGAPIRFGDGNRR